MVINGFRIHSTDMADVQMELFKSQQKLSIIANREYGRLLGKETAFLCDNVAVNILNRDPDRSLLDIASESLERKIMIAGRVNAPTEYNFQIYAYVVADGEYTYLEVSASNEKLLKAFQNMESYSLSEEECTDPKNQKTITWTRIHKTYKEEQPLVKQMTPVFDREKAKIVYPSVKERANTLSRHTVTNAYLNQISGGEQIPPYLLMEDMDIAMALLLTPDGKRRIAEKTTELKRILVDLEKDTKVVETIPSKEKAEAEKQAD